MTLAGRRTSKVVNIIRNKTQIQSTSQAASKGLSVSSLQCHIVPLSHCGILTMRHCHRTTLSNCNHATLLHCQILWLHASRQHCATVTIPCGHRTTMYPECLVTLSPCRHSEQVGGTKPSGFYNISTRITTSRTPSTTVNKKHGYSRLF